MIFNDMYGDQFYPTPEATIAKMVAILEIETTRDWRGQDYPFTYFPNHQVYLDPSAGDGAILDYLHNKKDVPKSKIKSLEIDPNLGMILQEKGYNLLDSDFLEFNEPYHFDVIMMNPPFRNGAQHFLKAWEIVADGGDVICILPTHLQHQGSGDSFYRRRLREVIAENEGQWIDVGKQFADARRQTDIEVSIVHVHKPISKDAYEFGGNFDTEYDVSDEEFSANPLAHADMLTSLVNQYDAAKQTLIEIYQLEKKKRFFLTSIKGPAAQSETSSKQKDLQERLDGLKKDFWTYIFNKTKIGQVTTSNFQKKFYAQLEAQQQMAFTVKNIRQILSVFFLNQKIIMDECLSSVFDKATAYHEKNKVHLEGWKTNKAWKVNKRIIHPYGVSLFYGSFRCWDSRDFFNDLDKALCMISGKKIGQITTIYEVLGKHCDGVNKVNPRTPYPLKYSDWIESTHFRIRMYKKGTVHLDFKDPQLLADFNYHVAKGRGWIGGGY